MYNASFLNLLSHLVLKAKRIVSIQGQKENSDLVLESDSKLLIVFATSKIIQKEKSKIIVTAATVWCPILGMAFSKNQPMPE